MLAYEVMGLILKIIVMCTVLIFLIRVILGGFKLSKISLSLLLEKHVKCKRK